MVRARWPAVDRKAFTAVPVGSGFRVRRRIGSPGKRREGVRDDVVLRRIAGAVPRNGRTAYRDAAMHTHASILSTEVFNQCYRFRLFRGVLYGGKARQPTGEESHGNLRDGDLDAPLRSLAAPHRRSALCDAIETTAYNALAGAMTPDGSGFAKYSPLEGIREFGEKQCGMELNCCEANGPRGIMLLPQVAVMKSAEGPAFNLYSEGVWDLRLSSGTPLRIETKTDLSALGLGRYHAPPHAP